MTVWSLWKPGKIAPMWVSGDLCGNVALQHVLFSIDIVTY